MYNEVNKTDLDADQLAAACIDVMLEQDRCSATLGIRLAEVRAGHAVMTMTITETMVNGLNICHGGMIFTLADSTFACTCNGQNLAVVASGCNIDFLRPAMLGDTLTATGTERKRGKRSGICDIEVYNQKQQLVALFRGCGAITNTPMLPPDPSH